MTEREHRTSSEGVKDNVRDELAEAAGYRKEGAPEEEEQAGSGRVKDTVRCANAPVGSGAKERIRMNAQTTDNGRQQHQQSPLKQNAAPPRSRKASSPRLRDRGSGGRGHQDGSSTTQTVGNIMSAVPGVGSQSESRGVSVEVGEVEAAVDLSMSVEYGRTIHQIAESVHERHKTGREFGWSRVTEVNITVSNIFFPAGGGAAAPRAGGPGTAAGPVKSGSPESQAYFVRRNPTREGRLDRGPGNRRGPFQVARRRGRNLRGEQESLGGGGRPGGSGDPHVATTVAKADTRDRREHKERVAPQAGGRRTRVVVEDLEVGEMSVFNRIVMTLLFAGLFVLGVYTVVYSFDLFGRSLSSLPISDFSSGLQDFVTRVEDGNRRHDNYPDSHSNTRPDLVYRRTKTLYPKARAHGEGHLRHPRRGRGGDLYGRRAGSCSRFFGQREGQAKAGGQSRPRSQG